MSLILSGTDGLSDVDGTVSTPAIRGTDSNTGIFFPAADTIAFTEGGVESMRINSSGNVGIGTSTFASGSRLAVQTTAGKFDVVANGGGSIGLVSSGAFLFNSNSTFLWSTGASDWMALDNSGRLSIGTTSVPSLYPAPLNVTATSAGAAAITIVGRASDNIGNVYFNSNSGATNYAYISASSTDFAIFNTTATGAFIFGTNSAERMRITSGAQLLVGVTTTSRTGQSRINSGGTQSSLLVECSGATVASGVLEVAASSAPSNTSNYLIVATTSAVDKFYVYSNGNVVNANNSYGSLSDQSIKENIVNATPKLDKINSVRVVNYNLIGDTQKQIGVVAQELETVFPSMVEIDGKTGLKQVKYSVFVPMLIKAMQEQQALIENLTTRLNALEGN